MYTTGQKLIYRVGGIDHPVVFIMAKWLDVKTPEMALVLDRNNAAITVLMSELHADPHG